MSWNRDWNAFNKDVIEQFRANGGRVPGRKYPVILLTTTGAKTGSPRTTPLNYSIDGERIVVIASKAASPRHPDWYHNLVVNPEAIVELGSETLHACARVFEGAERDRLYAQHALALGFSTSDYRQKTTRQIPVIILARIG